MNTTINNAIPGSKFGQPNSPLPVQGEKLNLDELKQSLNPKYARLTKGELLSRYKNLNEKYQNKIIKYFHQYAQASEKATLYLAYIYGFKQDYTNKHHWLKAAIALFKSPVAMNELGLVYLNGDECNKDHIEAFKLFYSAVSLNYKPARVNLAICYQNGYGVTLDYKVAYELLIKADDENDYEASNMLGACYLFARGVDKNDDQAFNYFYKAAVKGHDVDAMENLAYCYSRGIGHPKDKTKAVKWFELAAYQGKSNSMVETALCYYYAKGVVQNYAKCLYWLNQAVKEENNMRAKFNLGALYAEGKIVDVDLKKGIEYIQEAANNDEISALQYMGNVYETGKWSQYGFAENPQLAFYWYKKAADKDLPTSMAKVAKYLERGTGTNQDIPAALDWYHKLIDNGHYIYMADVARIYKDGPEAIKNQEKALNYLQTLATKYNELGEAEKLKSLLLGAGNLREEIIASFALLSANIPLQLQDEYQQDHISLDEFNFSEINSILFFKSGNKGEQRVSCITSLQNYIRYITLNPTKIENPITHQAPLFASVDDLLKCRGDINKTSTN